VLHIPVLVGLLFALGQRAPSPPPTHASALPPISYTCPMDPDIVEDKPGACPRCRMTLEPIRLDTAYACPVHTAQIQEKPGVCRIDGRPLVPVTVSLFFTCAGNQTVRELAPGTCPDGGPRLASRERRAHGDHNPRHGGEFFMASDNLHHLEGTYPRDGVFRLYFYDDFTRPLTAKAIGGFTARAVTRERFDPATKTYDEVEAAPLKMTPDGRALEARVPTGLPAQITAKVKFAADGSEHRFDFTFMAYSVEPKPGAPTKTAAAAAKPQFETLTAEAPQSIDALLDELASRNRQVDAAVRGGLFGEIYLSALAAKDAALALEARDGGLSADGRAHVSAAAKQIVLSAWQLDLYGDLGDRVRIEDAYKPFAAAVVELLKAYGR
jgi:hypothetical protein